MTKQLEINNLSVSFDNVNIINEISFSLNAGSIGCILGPSGCGKTTILRAIAGFQKINKGNIVLGGIQISSTNSTLPPERRNIGMVFQDFALFPNLTVEENILFGLRNWSHLEKQQRLKELLELINLKHLAKSYSHQLSGGQQQRIALARAMAPKPDILLLDEPFASMDVELREQLAREVRIMLKQENITAILVTHDQHEAFVMADEISVINEGVIQQHDSGYNLYHKPKNMFVAGFIGQGVLIDGKVIEKNKIATVLGIIEGQLPEDCNENSKVKVLIRPDDIIHDDHSKEQATIIEKAFKGAEFLYTLKTITGTKILCLAPSHHNHKVNDSIGIRLGIDHIVVFKQS